MASAFGLRPFRSEAVSASARVTWSLSMILNVSLLGRLRVETSTKLNKKIMMRVSWWRIAVGEH